MINDRRSFFKKLFVGGAASLLPKTETGGYGPGPFVRPKKPNGPMLTPGEFNKSPLFISKEALEDMRNWGVDQIDETTKRKIFS